MKKSKKIKTYTLCEDFGGSGGLVDVTMDNIKSEIEATELENDDDVIEYVIRIEKKYTKKDLEKMGEWDGF